MDPESEAASEGAAAARSALFLSSNDGNFRGSKFAEGSGDCCVFVFSEKKYFINKGSGSLSLGFSGDTGSDSLSFRFSEDAGSDLLSFGFSEDTGSDLLLFGFCEDLLAFGDELPPPIKRCKGQ